MHGSARIYQPQTEIHRSAPEFMVSRYRAVCHAWAAFEYYTSARSAWISKTVNDSFAEYSESGSINCSRSTNRRMTPYKGKLRWDGHWSIMHASGCAEAWCHTGFRHCSWFSVNRKYFVISCICAQKQYVVFKSITDCPQIWCSGQLQICEMRL